MNERKLNKVFAEIKEKANMDYAITNSDEYGDCDACVNFELVFKFGMDSKGIYAKHWLKERMPAARGRTLTMYISDMILRQNRRK